MWAGVREKLSIRKHTSCWADMYGLCHYESDWIANNWRPKHEFLKQCTRLWGGNTARVKPFFADSALYWCIVLSMVRGYLCKVIVIHQQRTNKTPGKMPIKHKAIATAAWIKTRSETADNQSWTGTPTSALHLAPMFHSPLSEISVEKSYAYSR